MNIVRIVANWREGGHRQKDFIFVLLCGIDINGQLQDGEWMGYTKNKSLFWPFTLRAGTTCFFGGDHDYEEPTNIGRGPIEVGRFFTISSSPEEKDESWEATYEITSVTLLAGEGS